MDDRTRIFLGPPGTGKTHKLLETLDELFKQGIEPRRVAFLAFTRKAAKEARERATEKFDFSPSDLVFFRTIHSFAFQQLGVTREEVMSAAHYKEIGEDLNMAFGQVDDELGLPTGAGKGDRHAYMEQLSRLTERPLQEVCLDAGVRYWDVQLYVTTLNRYKRARHLRDFTDLLEQYVSVGPIPDVDVVIVDEAQDLSKLQWDVVRKVCTNAQQIFIAGDDDQAIYKWAGADVQTFLTMPGKVEVLSRSYRLPWSVFEQCGEILKFIKHRYPKKWHPHGQRQGEVCRYASPEMIDYSSGSWLLLARNKYMLNGYKDYLTTKGFPYVLGEVSSIANSNVKAILSWEALRTGKEVPLEDVRVLFSKLKKQYKGEDAARLPGHSHPYITMNELCLDYGLLTSENWMEALQIPAAQREYYRAIKQRGESLTKAPRLHIASIHTVKGGEADNVALMSDMTTAPYNDYMRSADNEARVFYVGASRAKHGLHLIHPQTPRYFPL